MGRKFKIILVVLVGVFIVIQFVPSQRPANEPVAGYDFIEHYDVPADVEQVLRNACFDCHSQEVNYPWYAYVAPSSWLVSRDVRIGRSNLDFSRWSELDKKDKLKLSSEIGEEVEEGNMPLPIYLLMHPGASLDAAQRELILQWTEQLAEKIFEE